MVTKAARTDAVLGRLVDEQLRARGIEFEDDELPDRRKTLYQRRQESSTSESRIDDSRGEWEGTSWAVPLRQPWHRQLMHSMYKFLPKRDRGVPRSKRILIGFGVITTCVVCWLMLHGPSQSQEFATNGEPLAGQVTVQTVGILDVELQSTATSTIPTGFDETDPTPSPPVALEAERETDPEPMVSQQPATMFVHIAGGVASPGVVELNAGSRVVDAVRAAGGLLPSADADRVNLAAPLQDGLRIVVPLIGHDVPNEVPVMQPGTNTNNSAASNTPRASVAGSSGGLVNINTASATELDTLPGIGPSTATTIVAHRDQHGPFPSIDSLMEVRGIGQAKLDSLRDLITI